MNSNNWTMPWHEGVTGTQVLPIIDLDDDTIRVEAGPGTGKTFGLVRRVQRILHPRGLNVPGSQVLVVAFNRVIAKQLQKDIDKRLANSPHNGNPVIRTVHSLCLRTIGTHVRVLFPHEREAMIYDVLHRYSVIRQRHRTHKRVEQALRDHEAKHFADVQLWQAVQEWLARHNAQLISDLPGFLLDRLHGGDFGHQTYSHIIVDEFQDLTPGEQELFVNLRSENGNFMALGDPRQSIYAFRGNDREGLSKLEQLSHPVGSTVRDIQMTECQRCPKDIVRAANQLMGLYDTQEMTSACEVTANLHCVFWTSLESEAKGMAQAIVDNIHAHPRTANADNLVHLALVTRRQFGYRLREEILKLDQQLGVDLSFSESLLETWSVREAFIFFCLLVDSDAPTWRAWLGYQKPIDSKGFKAPKRNADAYLRFLTACSDLITESAVEQLASSSTKPPGIGGSGLWDRAKRFVEIKRQLRWDGKDALTLLREIFDPTSWDIDRSLDSETARLDMELTLAKACDICQELQNENKRSVAEHLRNIARRLRYQIATREPFVPDEACDLQITTLWGGKGITADHVYVIGLCKEAIPGTRREEYPGTDLEFKEEQRRLFYVSFTRCKKTLVLSRATSVARSEAKRLAFEVSGGSRYTADLHMSPFLRDIINCFPRCELGENWGGCAEGHAQQ
ncbi:MAG TPA: ATP-dependent helicase [Candidatus Deferrimicrobium sp.]|nr:ATP-dependent helicase [Candidatus Deferrimicrobium sp.]